MDKIKVYIDSIYKTNDSVSNSEFKFGIKEALDLGETHSVISMISASLIHFIP